MWTFLVELGEIVEENTGTDYPNLLFVKGQIPIEAPQINFDIEADENFDHPHVFAKPMTPGYQPLGAPEESSSLA